MSTVNKAVFAMETVIQHHRLYKVWKRTNH